MGTFPTGSHLTYQYLNFGGVTGWHLVRSDDTERGLTEVGNPNDIFQPGEEVSVEAGGAIPPGARFTYEGVFFYTGTSGTYEFLVVKTFNTSGTPSGQYYLFSSFDLGAIEWPSLFDDSQIQGTDRPVCFLAGTLIETSLGPRKVEELWIGDSVVTAGGGTTAVKWIGRQELRPLLAGAEAQPVRIRDGALGGGLPRGDLTLSADHGLVLDGFVINAGALVKGRGIDFVPLDELPDRVLYFHVETEAHELILAEGVPAETYLEHVTPHAFENGAERAARTIPEMHLPRITSPRLLPPEVRERLAAPEPA